MERLIQCQSCKQNIAKNSCIVCGGNICNVCYINNKKVFNLCLLLNKFCRFILNEIPKDDVDDFNNLVDT